MAFRALVAGLILVFSLATPVDAVVPELRQPKWAELPQEQKQILAPLARDWDGMEAFRKKKWLGIAKRYPTMAPQEQARVQRRMQDWAGLTPEQRAKARTQYRNLKTAPPETKENIRKKWEQYKELPDEEKQRLAEKAVSRPSPKPGMAKPSGLSAKLTGSKPQPLPAPAAPPPPAPAPTPVPATPSADADAPAGASQGEPPPPAQQAEPTAPAAPSPAATQPQ